ncbi:MAG: TraB/GumN family protein [Prevotella sp.]|jgi:uncharacterized protein YbaP (TraB family)
MKKLLTTMLFACACTIGASAQLMYKISGNGLEKPSYIIGTHHLANTGFVNQIPGVKEALTNTDQMYGELPWDDMMNPDSMKYMQSAMTLPEGKKLKDILNTEQYAKLNAYLKKTMQVDLSSPQVEAQMGSMTPMAMTTQLTLISFMMKHMGEFDPTNTFDQYFQAQAKKNNEYVGGLETVAFQTETLYKSFPMSRQVELLMCFLNHTTFIEQMNEKITSAFYAQNLDALKTAMDEKMNNSCDNKPEEDDLLINNRNADWLGKMPAIMAAKPTFFAVGAAHLPGEKGVLEGLKKLGYTVEGVK